MVRLCLNAGDSETEDSVFSWRPGWIKPACRHAEHQLGDSGSSQLWMRLVDPDPEDRVEKNDVGCVGRWILRLLEVDQSG